MAFKYLVYALRSSIFAFTLVCALNRNTCPSQYLKPPPFWLWLQISRDCQELEPSVGEQLVHLLYQEPDSELMVSSTRRLLYIYMH